MTDFVKRHIHRRLQSEKVPFIRLLQSVVGRVRTAPGGVHHPEQYKAVNAIRVCRTAALGIDTYACPDCGEVREISHSCKNRFCPSCGWHDTLK